MTKPLVCALLSLLSSGPLAAHDPLAFASGSWFDPQRNGEGFVVQILPEERAVVTWFTYPPRSEDGVQAWMIGTGVTVDNRIEIDEMVRPRGAVFGPDFDPADVVREPWGRLELTFDSCDSAEASWQGPPEFGNGSMSLMRLSSIDDVGCDPNLPAEPDRVIAGRSGAWYDPSHDGEGWMLEMLGDGRMVVYWFTYDDQGRQAWMIGEARVEGRTLWVEELLVTSGARFGDDFDPADVTLADWGSLGFLFEDCAVARLRYESDDLRFGAGTLEPVHLAQLAATGCAEPPAEAPLSNGTWRLSTDLATAVSESASVAMNGYVYVAGGFGNLRGLLRYEPQAESWTSLPDMPGERHHPMAATDGRYLYLGGGYVSRISDAANSNFWRYDPQSSEWTTLTDMPRARAAGAAVYLHGRIWVVGGANSVGSFMAYDIGSAQWELLTGAPRSTGDHSQALVFENEIWWLGGRDNRTARDVVIWNPVTREWREGPTMLYARSGFAARVVRGQIMVAGGERLDTVPFQLVPTMEVFAPGAVGWAQGPSPPIAVHGVAGASIADSFILTAGSDVAGSTSLNRATQVYDPAAQ